MRLVKQKRIGDCGIAAMAMSLEVPYYSIRSIALDLRPECLKHGLNHDNITDIVSMFDYRTKIIEHNAASQWVTWNDVSPGSILQINWHPRPESADTTKIYYDSPLGIKPLKRPTTPSRSNKHYVVWDGHRILDPYYGATNPTTIYSKANIEYEIEIK